MELLSILDLHWNEDAKMYCDVGINSDGTAYYFAPPSPLTMRR